MTKIIIYTTDHCPYCVKAKSLLQRKKVNFTEIKVNNDQIREEMIAKSSGRKSVPQIFINGKYVGGCDDLYELESQNKLDQLLI